MVAFLEIKGLVWVIILTTLGVGFGARTVALAKRGSDSKLIEGEEDPVLSLEGDDELLPAIEGE